MRDLLDTFPVLFFISVTWPLISCCQTTLPTRIIVSLQHSIITVILNFFPGWFGIDRHSIFGSIGHYVSGLLWKVWRVHVRSWAEKGQIERTTNLFHCSHSRTSSISQLFGKSCSRYLGMEQENEYGKVCNLKIIFFSQFSHITSIKINKHIGHNLQNTWLNFALCSNDPPCHQEGNWRLMPWEYQWSRLPQHVIDVDHSNRLIFSCILRFQLKKHQQPLTFHPLKRFLPS